MDPDFGEGDETYENEMSEKLVTTEESPLGKGQAIRKIKRTNLEACKFRIKFKFDELSNGFRMKTDSNLAHNHAPEDSLSVKVSQIPT